MGRQDFETETLLAVGGFFDQPRAYRTAGDGCVFDEGDRTAPLTTASDPCANIVTHALRGEGFDASEDGTGRGTPLVPIAHVHVLPAMFSGMAVRRLTPLECERLMAFPDGYTAVPQRGGIMADGPRYKMLGNSMVTLCMKWIGQRIEAVNAYNSAP